MGRSCDGCTKCCEGWLTTSVEGHNLYRGNPCPFVVIDQGCSRHETRPEDPCRVFQCAWVSNPDVPEWLKPDAANVILMEREIDGHRYVAMTPTGVAISSSLLSWFITWGLQHYGNVFWETELTSQFFLGNPDFSAVMSAKVAANKNNAI